MKIRPVEAELFNADRQTDGQTDMRKLIIGFRNFANAPKIYQNKKYDITALFSLTVAFFLRDLGVHGGLRSISMENQIQIDGSPLELHRLWPRSCFQRCCQYYLKTSETNVVASPYTRY